MVTPPGSWIRGVLPSRRLIFLPVGQLVRYGSECSMEITVDGVLLRISFDLTGVRIEDLGMPAHSPIDGIPAIFIDADAYPCQHRGTFSRGFPGHGPVNWVIEDIGLQLQP